MRGPTRSRRSLLTKADKYLADWLREINRSVMTPYGFFRLIQEMYREGSIRSLRRETVPNERTYYRYFGKLARLDMIDSDPDYGSHLVWVRIVSSQPAEEIVCMADPLCHLSHLSAMQRWGLTDRSPNVMTFTRPDRETARSRLLEIMENYPAAETSGISAVALRLAGDPEKVYRYPQPPERFRLRVVPHPERARQRAIQVMESRTPGDCVEMPDRPLRLATVGQTFLDMLQRPELCGGMSHVLEVCDVFAEHWRDEIIAAVNTCNKKVVRCRAGYILEERLGIRHKAIDQWKATAPQRGGNCKLDPSRDYAPTFSEAWMLSLNV